MACDIHFREMKTFTQFIPEFFQAFHPAAGAACQIPSADSLTRQFLSNPGSGANDDNAFTHKEVECVGLTALMGRPQ